MLLNDVIEHCRPDFVVPQHRTIAIEEQRKEQPHKSLLEITTPAHVLYSYESRKHRLTHSHL
jgi:hypothetical protein